MRDIDLFQVALGLVPPWMVAAADFDAERKQLDIEIDFKTGGRFACPECGKAELPGARHRQEDLAAFGISSSTRPSCTRASRVLTVPIAACASSMSPWARPGSGFTLLLRGLCHDACHGLSRPSPPQPASSASTIRVCGEWSCTTSRRPWRAWTLPGLRRVAIDETAARRGHNYITLFVDIDGRKVVYVAEGRGAETVAKFADHVDDHNWDASRIKQVCIDMSAAYIRGVTDNLTEAEITFDKFHAVKLVNDAVAQGAACREQGAAGAQEEPLSLAAQ